MPNVWDLIINNFDSQLADEADCHLELRAYACSGNRVVWQHVGKKVLVRGVRNPVWELSVLACDRKSSAFRPPSDSWHVRWVLSVAACIT